MNVLEKILEEIKDNAKLGSMRWETIRIEKVEEIIRSHMDEVRNDDWIPVTKQLPEENERYKGRKVIDVLVTTAQGNVTKVQRQSHNDCWWWGRIYGEPRAWKPLPEPYKGD